MKKPILLLILMVFAIASNAQTGSFTLVTAPCNNNGILNITVTGLTPPLTVNWYTEGLSGTTITHTGVTTLTDALTSYSGGPVYVWITDAGSGYVSTGYAGAPPFTYVASTTSATCPALGTASVTVTGGTAPYTYSWFDASTYTVMSTSNPASLPAGNYGVTITDAGGCVYGSLVNNDSLTIYNIPTFSITTASTIASCTNGTASVTAVSAGAVLPVSYAWSTGATTPSISGLVMGSYTVGVTDAAGCTAANRVYVSQSITINPHVTPTPATCISSNGAVIAFGSGGVPPYSYVWSNGATTATQTGLPAGYYGVTATDANGCIGTGGGYVNSSTPITVTYTATPSLCTSATGSASITLAGGTAPYTTTWHTIPAHTGTTVSSLAPGNYSFDVVDAAGCTQHGTVVVPPVNIITATFAATPALCTMSNGALHVSPSGGAVPYTYLWNTGSTTSTISSVPAGWYDVTITDNVGCSVTKYHDVPVHSPLGVGISSTPASCIFTADGSLTATPYGSPGPFTYSWTGGGTTGTITGRATGNYWLTVTDAAGCTVSDYAYLGYNTSATSCYCTISGTVYNDVNGNCIQDAGEAGIQNIQIYCSGIGYTYTDMSGHYSFIVPSGTYTVTETVLAFYPLSACQLNNISVTAVAGTGCVHTVDFGNSISTIHDMHISTWDYNAAIPGNPYTQVSIVSNEGTVSESGVLAGYNADGQLLAPSFTPSGIFLGAPYWYNTSAGFPSLSPGGSSVFYMNYSVPTTIPIGTPVVFKDSVAYTAPMSNWLTDYSPWNNVEYFTTYVRSSYDPNFKEVIPQGTGATGIIPYTDSVLEYMVHFQNTGTAPAQNIVVLDTLDNNLDWTSLSPIYQSAKCSIIVTQDGSYKVAKFSFPNINLPAQSTDDLRSNGMFTYTIKTKRGLPVGTTFKNSASIYFDYNAPIKTNSTINTLGSTLAVTNTTLSQPGEHSFTVYPNPAGESFSAIINSNNAVTASLNVTDISGRVLINKTISLQHGTQTVATDVSKLTPGVYFVTLDENGNTQTQKLVIMK
jgi:uncharacterized repeat protein (TIGR01451 family)